MSAHAAADRARAETVRARTELDTYTVGYFKRQAEAAAAAAQQAPPEAMPPLAAPVPLRGGEEPAAAQVENPRWSAARRQLQELEQRHDELLASRTVEHPDVQNCLARITWAQQRLAAIPRWIPAPAGAAPVDRMPSVASSPAAAPHGEALPGKTNSAVQAARQQAAAEEARQAADVFRTLKARLQRAIAAEEAATAQERAAFQWSAHLPEVCVELARPPVAVAVVARPHAGHTWLAAAALTALSGLAMLVVARRADRRLTTAAEALAAVDLPLVGVVAVEGSPHDITAPIWRERASWHVWMACGVMGLGGGLLAAAALLACKLV